MSGRRSTPLLAPPLALLLLLLLFLPPWMKVSFCIPQCSLEREGGSIRWASTSSLPLIASSAALGIASAADAKEEEEEEVVPFSSTSVKPKHRYLRDNIRVVLLNEEEMEKKKAGRSMPSDGRIIEETTKFSFIFPHLSTSTTTTTTRKPDKFHSFQPTTQLRIPEGSLYPSDFHLIYPDVDEVRPDDPQDPVEYLYSPEFRREDLLHTPFAYSLGYQSFAGIQLSNFATSGFLIGESERAALLEDTAQRASREGQADASPVPTEAQLQRPERSFSPAKEDAAAAEEEKSMRNTTTAPAPVEVPLLPTAERVRSPKELLRRLIRGDGSYSPLGLRPFTDRYVVQQMDPGVFRRSFCDILVQLMHLPDRPPLVISLFNLSPGKMALRCLFYRTHQFLTAKRKFVIVAAEGDYPAAVSFFVDPDLWDFPILNLSFLLHHPLLAHWYGVNGNINHPKFTPLPIGYRFFHRAGETLLPYDRTRRLNEEKQHINGNPEVNSTLLTRIFEDLPVVVVQNATDITEENMKVWQQEIFEKAKRGEYNLEKLFMQTWIDRIYGHTNDRFYTLFDSVNSSSHMHLIPDKTVLKWLYICFLSARGDPEKLNFPFSADLVFVLCSFSVAIIIRLSLVFFIIIILFFSSKDFTLSLSVAMRRVTRHKRRTKLLITVVAVFLLLLQVLYLLATTGSPNAFSPHQKKKLTVQEFMELKDDPDVSMDGAFVMRFTAVPPHDMEFQDDDPSPPAVIPLPDVIREDVFHTPLPTGVGYEAFAGLQLHSFTTTGIHMGVQERRMLEWHQHVHGTLNNTRLKAREVLPKLIQGDAIPVPLSLQLFTDRYFIQQIHPGVFKNHFCNRFVELMHIENQRPLVVNMYNAQAARFVLRCLYYRTHSLKEAQRKLVLLTSGGNETAASSFFTEELQEYTNVTVPYLLNHPLLVHWYGVNGNIQHPKFTPLPMGFLFYHRSGRSLLPPSVDRRRQEEQAQKAVMEQFIRGLDLRFRIPKVVVDFHNAPPVSRTEMYTHLVDSGLAVFPGGADGAPLADTLQTRYLAMNDHAFVASPIGESFDHPRVWEALALGAIPLVQNPIAFQGTVDAATGPKEKAYGKGVKSAALLDVYKGLPVVVVNDTAQITPENLEKWRADIHERAKKGLYEMRKLFLQTWISSIYGHDNE
eukprot:gene5775-4126_t